MAAARATLHVGDALPAVLTLKHLADVLGLGLARTYELQQAGELQLFELQPRIGNRARYSGRKVQAWLNGDLVPATSVLRRKVG